MNLLIILKTTLKTLTKNKLRSSITLLGIVLGIATVVAMYNIGLGVKDKVVDLFKNLGSNVILIRNWSWNKSYFERFREVTIEDAEFIKEKCSDVYLIMPYSGGNMPVRYKNTNQRAELFNTSADYFYISDKKLESGSFFGISDQKLNSNVCVLGQSISKKLFKSADAVGGTIIINNIPFKIIGVLEHIPREDSSFSPNFPDGTVFLPYTTSASKLGLRKRGVIGSLVIFAYPNVNLDELAKKIKKILNDKYHINNERKEAFNVETINQYLEFRNKRVKDLNNLLTAIAIIALFISGVNIMNIMLVSVKERTREIGIRLALGARKKDIILQFLAESIVLCLLGGIIGAVISFPLSLFGAKLFDNPAKFSYNIIFVTFFYSALLGIVFGVYPASKAASIEPIEALRYE